MNTIEELENDMISQLVLLVEKNNITL
jgi:hypothetical protein